MATPYSISEQCEGMETVFLYFACCFNELATHLPLLVGELLVILENLCLKGWGKHVLCCGFLR